jgi:iron complex outermembrane receptor protein
MTLLHALLPALSLLPVPQEVTPRQAGRGEGETLVVTARKLAEELDEVPASVTVVDGAALDMSGTPSVREATSRVPNLLFAEFSSRRLSFPFVRGIGSGIGEPSVVTYVDGVPQLAVGSTNLPPIDLERIEVLRGPQGTLYGRNALGGVLHLISERPGPVRETEVSATAGNEGLLEVRASHTSPFESDGTGVTITALSSRRDGYTTNRVTGNDVDSREGFFGRAQVVLAPTDDSELRIALYAEHANDGGFVLGPLASLRDTPFRIDQDFEGQVDRDVLSPSIHYTRRGDTFDFTSITSLTDWDVTETSDFDFTAIDGVRRRTSEDQTFLYQELRLSSPEDEDEVLRWVVGLAGFAADSGRAAENDFRPGGAGIFFPPLQVGVDTNDGSFDDLGVSVFGQVTVPLGDDFELTGGLRYDREEKEAELDHTFVAGGFTVVDESRSFEEDFDEVSPTVALLWRASETANVYALAASAFKAGGFNLTAPGNAYYFEPETSWTYEVGVRLELSERIAARIAVFHTDWEDMQLSLFDPMAGGYVDNAGEATSRGLELELDARIADGWSAYGSAGLVDTEFDEFTDSFGFDDAGNDLPFAPEHTLALGVRHTRPVGKGLSLDVGAEAQRIGDYYYDPSNLEAEGTPSSTCLRACAPSAGVSRPSSATLLDEEYVPIAFQANPADPTFFVGENAAPRTFGVTIGFSF